MSPEDKKHLQRIKTFEVREDVPSDLRVAIQTFIQQAVIVGENDLDYMPPEYMENLIKSFAKYPEYSIFLLDMIEILERNDLLDK